MASNNSSAFVLTGCAGFKSAFVAPGSRLGCVRGVRRSPLHADSRRPGEDNLETTEEGTAVQGARSWGGDNTDATQELEIEEVDAADAHAGHRCSKQTRTSSP